MNQASVGFHCPECARAGRQKVYSARTLVTQPVVTLAIIAINAAVYIADILSRASVAQNAYGTLNDRGALVGLLKVLDNGRVLEIGVGAGEWWRVVTGGFLHVNLIHIGFNMFLLWQLGQMLEPALGRIGFAVLYTMSLLGGSFLVLAVSPDKLTVGASGAVFGLMGAAFVGLRSRGIDPFSTGIGGLIVINLVLTFALSRYISVGGHIGGLLTGALGGYLLLDVAPRIRDNGMPLMIAACAAIAGLLFAGSIWIAYNPVF